MTEAQEWGEGEARLGQTVTRFGDTSAGKWGGPHPWARSRHSRALTRPVYATAAKAAWERSATVLRAARCSVEL